MALGLVALACSAAPAPDSESGRAGAEQGEGAPGTFVLEPAGPNSAEDACEAVVQQAEERPGGRADIVFVLDNSGSMTEEVLAVQNNMNAFSQQIASSGIDAHVVVISAGPPGGQAAPCTDFLDPNCWTSFIGAWANQNGVCIDPPLGRPGACPDGDDTHLEAGYMHWREEVGSHNALEKIQSTFEGWRGMLRPDAAKTFVVVTDDENDPPPTANDFVSWADGQPELQQALWRFSGIYCITDSDNCSGQGTTYDSLVDQTGGISGDMAEFSTGQVDAQFGVVFDSLAEAVVRDAVPVDCEWQIPVPPEGETLDPNAVNVNYTSSMGTTETILGVQAAGDCTDEYGGWYYDDPSRPSRVIACPQSCAVMQADEGAKVEVLFGCARQLAPIE